MSKGHSCLSYDNSVVSVLWKELLKEKEVIRFGFWAREGHISKIYCMLSTTLLFPSLHTKHIYPKQQNKQYTRVN